MKHNICQTSDHCPEILLMSSAQDTSKPTCLKENEIPKFRHIQVISALHNLNLLTLEIIESKSYPLNFACLSTLLKNTANKIAKIDCIKMINRAANKVEDQPGDARLKVFKTSGMGINNKAKKANKLLTTQTLTTMLLEKIDIPFKACKTNEEKFILLVPRYRAPLSTAIPLIGSFEQSRQPAI
jgi:hypothetical protein